MSVAIYFALGDRKKIATCITFSIVSNRASLLFARAHLVDDKNFSNLPTQVSQNKYYTLCALEIRENLYGCCKLDRIKCGSPCYFLEYTLVTGFLFVSHNMSRLSLQNEQILHRRDKIPFGSVKLKVTVVVHALFV